MVYKNATLVDIVTADRLTLPGILFAPKRKTKKALIYLHGNGNSSVFYSLDKLAPQAVALNKAGIAYFAFNNRGAHQYFKLDRMVRGKEERVPAGTAYELIKDCIKDIDAAVAFLQQAGYTELYLIGFSTGANKICVYNYYKPKNKIAKYILACGGDDTGIYYTELGRKKFYKLLQASKLAISKGKGKELVPYYLFPGVYSYQSLHDILNPDGDYNTFPYQEYFNKLKLSSKKLFRHYGSIKKPTLVVYGDQDEYTYGKVPEIIETLKDKASDLDKFQFKVIKDADHGFTGKNEELMQIIVKWLKF